MSSRIDLERDTNILKSVMFFIQKPYEEKKHIENDENMDKLNEKNMQKIYHLTNQETPIGFCNMNYNMTDGFELDSERDCDMFTNSYSQNTISGQDTYLKDIQQKYHVHMSECKFYTPTRFFCTETIQLDIVRIENIITLFVQEDLQPKFTKSVMPAKFPQIFGMILQSTNKVDKDNASPFSEKCEKLNL